MQKSHGQTEKTQEGLNPIINQFTSNFILYSVKVNLREIKVISVINLHRVYIYIYILHFKILFTVKS